MEDNGGVHNSVTHTTVLVLCFILVTLLILLFFLYKYLNKEANGKYTVRRVVYRKGGLRDRARGAAVALGNRLGVQLWPKSDTDEDEENGEDEEEANSEGSSSSSDEDEVDEMKSGSTARADNAKGSSGDGSESSSETSSDEEEHAEARPEPESKAEAAETEGVRGEDVPQNKAGETSAPIVINLNQFSGSVVWSGEDNGEGDVTAL